GPRETKSGPGAEADRRGYRPIADYGLIGDIGSAALVASDGSIDWCCWPHFDRPALFSRLLDAERGGYFAITPTAAFASDRAYIDGTNVLQTTLSTPDGRVRLTDFMPLTAEFEASDANETTRILFRRVECLTGEVDLHASIRMMFDWGATPPTFSHRPWGILAEADGATVGLVGPESLEVTDNNLLTWHATVSAGDEVWFRLQYLPDRQRPPSPIDPDRARQTLDTTVDYWREWLEKCTYDGPGAEVVRRSALALKLLTDAPSGAVVAAPTSSLPETIGGVRNWDYRYVWLRDAGMTLRSLQNIGYHEEALAFWEWLESICLTCSGDIQSVYRIDGSTDLAERELEGFDGYAGSKPVRVGNHAAGQLQLDRYGYLLEAAFICQRDLRDPDPDLEPLIRTLVERVCDEWTEPDRGIWEISAEKRHFTHSKLGCWVALDRALRLADRGWLNGDLARWRKHRRELRVAIEHHGYNREIASFTQTFDGDRLDASVAMIPLAGFLSFSDPRVQSTLESIERHLTEDGLVKRYRTTDNSPVDGMPGREGGFVLCTCWLISALAESGRHQKAERLFDHLLAQANDLDLFAEEIDPDDHRFLGNFPQGYSHLAVIEAALRLYG
ncbi:MAG: glycoside hydrolase family 15 protein, partial [Bradymonadaceae bacterium]